MANFRQDHMNDIELICHARGIIDGLITAASAPSILDIDAVPKLQEVRKDLEALRQRLSKRGDPVAVKVD